MGVRRAFGDGGITTGGRACCAASVAAALVGRTGAEGLPLHGVGSLGPPRSGDLSHPGFVECSSNHGLVSWHASHRSASHETGPDGKPITAIDRADLVCH